LMQFFAHESDPLLDSRHVAVLAVRDGLPDLAGHRGHLTARGDAAVPAMNDRLAGLGRHFEAGFVSLR